MALVALMVTLLAGCKSESDPPASQPLDAAPAEAPEADAAPASTMDQSAPPSTPDAAAPDAGAMDDRVPASDYCERAVDVFCPYYVRCQRMAVPDEATCRSVFIEACNAKYEPIYVAHAAAGELRLSAAGLATCRDHLAGVACSAHNFDLDGPCAAVWQGLVEAPGACGPGIGSFVCADGHRCVLDVQTFCGTCEPAVPIGAACGDEARCGDDGQCVDGVCARRPTAGEACAEGGPRCVTGTACADGRCAIRPWAGPGEACGQAARCRYKTECVDGQCQEGVLHGAPCAAHIDCASGWCDAGRCAPPKAAGEPCAVGAECVSGGCQGGRCFDERGACFAR